MMADKFYIKREGHKVYRASVKAITDLAHELADKTGIGVPVYVETIGIGKRAASIHRDAPFVRNPIGMEHAEHLARMSGEREAREARLAHRMSDDYFPPARMTVSKAANSNKRAFIVRATKAGKVQTVKVGSEAQAREVAEAFAASGFRAVVETNNPGPTKASKARRTASNKRGAYVEYIEGTTKKRIKYGNKGIATIRAAAMKRDGWRGVRVVSA